jgi:hypothetical protein
MRCPGVESRGGLSSGCSGPSSWFGCGILRRLPRVPLHVALEELLLEALEGVPRLLLLFIAGEDIVLLAVSDAEHAHSNIDLGLVTRHADW